MTSQEYYYKLSAAILFTKQYSIAILCSFNFIMMKINEKGIKLLILITCITLVSGSITTINSSTTLSEYCSSSPNWKLDQCNITCKTCSSGNSDLCSSCYDNYTFSNSQCFLNNNTYFLYYQSYATSAIIKVTDAENFVNPNTYQSLGRGDIVSICLNQSYHFQMLGLFGRDDSISLTLDMTEQISYVTVAVRVLILMNDVTLNLDINGNTQTKNYNALSNMTGTYYQAKFNETKTNYLNLPALNSNNAESVVHLIYYQYLISQSKVVIELDLSVSDGSKFWAFSDMSIILRQCETCPTTTLTNKISSIGTITAYTLAVTVPLLLIFLCMIKIGNYIRHRKMLMKMGVENSSKITIPLKALDRVKDTLSSYIATNRMDNLPQNNRKMTIREAANILRKTQNKYN